MLIHVVQKGDSLWFLSRRYAVSMNEIVEANQLPDPNILVIGQALVIPLPDYIHVVQPGDSLWLIAQQYRISVDQIINANKIIDPNKLFIGQRLVIPIKYRIHIVQPRDTLWLIAQKNGTSMEAIAQENQITDPTLIYPGQILKITKPIIEVNGYLTVMGTSGQQIVREIGGYLSYLSPFSYQIKEDGGLQALNESGVLEVATSENIEPMMVITNFTEGSFNSDLAHTILINPNLQDTLLTNIMNTMKQKSYSLLNIDFEYIHAQDREFYNQFLRKTVARLQKEGYLVSTALAPKLSGEQKGKLYEAHDYPAHGDIVDFVVLMTYEWGWIGGPPMAVAPLNEVRRVLDYAVSVIPRNKIMMGMPTYGYDWKLPYVRGESLADVISPQEAIHRAIKYGVSIQYDDNTQSPYYKYFDETGKEHIVWFEDARSVQAKYKTVKEYNLRGVSYWELSYHFLQNWYVLVDNFQILK